MKIQKFLIIFIASMSYVLNSTYAACTIHASTKEQVNNLADGIAILLSSNKSCPKNAIEFREQIKAANLTLKTTMVANRGYHNPSQGSFSLFEMVIGDLDSRTIQPGDFFFGHFTDVNKNDELILDQGPTAKPRLMIEAFAWDANKELFNFYELIGDGNNNQWFYRGDSADIYADNALLHRQADPSHPKFGNRLRCSGCHLAGGPIMKEISAPHNDWWEPNRKLDFGGRKFDKLLFDIMQSLVPPDRLEESTILGIKKLDDSKGLDGNTLSLQEKLRPLFCPMEVNLKSDLQPNENKNQVVSIPVEFFVNNKLTRNKLENIKITRDAYEYALTSTKSHFPETSLNDADHAWLTPVKATSDQLAIDRLIKIGLIDNKFAYDVLSVDMTNPVSSDMRCGLLGYVPVNFTADWKDKFIQQLKVSNNFAALDLAKNMVDPSHTPEYHQKKAMDLLMNCNEQLKDKENVKKLYLLLAQRRAEIKASQISKNPRGQILEPGFRVIFPETSMTSQRLMLTDTCQVKTVELPHLTPKMKRD